jgi:enoyl-CoA hydratase/carnithine racemase
MGFVNRAVADQEVLEEALTYARMLAAESSPASMAIMKRQVYGDYERSLEEALEEANRLMGQSFSGHDFREGVESFLERRPPNFDPLTTSSSAPA